MANHDSMTWSEHEMVPTPAQIEACPLTWAGRTRTELDWKPRHSETCDDVIVD